MIIPRSRSFRKEKKIYEDDKKVTYKGHYGASVKHDGSDMEFYWGDGTRSYSKNKKARKLVRYLKNKKGLDVHAKQDLTLGCEGPPDDKKWLKKD